MKRLMFLCIWGVLAYFVYPPPVWANQQVLEVTLCGGVRNRVPMDVFEPVARCSLSKTMPDSVPIISSKQFSTVYLWAVVSSDAERLLKFTWYKNGVAAKMQRSEYHHADRQTSFIDDVKPGTGWKNLASMEFKAPVLKDYRVWSQKSMNLDMHDGEWKIEITPADEPKNVLCAVYFRVKE